MGLKRYIVSTVILLGIIGAYVYNLNLGNYTVVIDTKIEGYILEQSLEIYQWILSPALLLFIFSILHLMYYGSKAYFVKQAFINDVTTIDTYIKERLLNQKSNKKLKTKEVRNLANILNSLDINPTEKNDKIENKELDELTNKVSQINNNEFISIKSLKLEDSNTISKLNLKNRVINDSNFALEVIKNSTKYSDEIISLAFDNILENKSLDKIKTNLGSLSLTDKMLNSLLLKDSTASAENRYTNSEILLLLQENNLSKYDLINIARNYKRTMQPEQLIKLFEDISAEDETLTESYLYVLFEYEMLSEIKEILVNSQKNEYMIYKALMDLKEAGKHYSVESFLFTK